MTVPNIESVVDGALLERIGPYVVEESRRAFNNLIYVCSTPEFRYGGVIVKSPLGDKSEREAEVLDYAGRSMTQGKYRVPGLVFYDEETGTIAVQRLFGSDGFRRIMDRDISVPEFCHDVASWLTVYNNLAVVEDSDEYRTGATTSFIQFKRRLMGDREKMSEFPGYERMLDIVNARENQVMKGRQVLLHGDPGLGHFIYENGDLYGIDLNDSHTGPRSEDAGQFLSNLSYSLECEGFSREDVFSGSSQFVEHYFAGEERPRDIPLYLAKCSFDKSRIEPGEGRLRLLSAALRQLEADEFTPELLEF
jgi:hypothetical protein